MLFFARALRAVFVKLWVKPQKMLVTAKKMLRFFEKNCHVLKISRSLGFLKKNGV